MRELFILSLSVPLPAPDHKPVVKVLRVVDTVAGGQHHLRSDEGGAAQVDVHHLILVEAYQLEC